MPIALDPNEVYRYVISTDRKTETNPPTLLFRYPTARQTRQIANLFHQSDKASTPDESLGFLEQAAGVILCGWENFPSAYVAGQLGAIISDSDFSELRARLIQDMSTSELERKMAALAENSAPSAPAKNAK